jgi:hypothetical protein
MKKFLAISAGICASLFLFALSMEVVDRNDYNLLSTDPATGLYRYAPDSSFNTAGDCYENKVEINNLGFHGPPVSVEKPKDAFRIVVIGSSYAAALQVPVSDMYSTLLEEKLNADPRRKYTYEVIPVALDQNRTLLDMFYYLNYGAALKPDVVINIESDYELTVHNSVDIPAFDAQGNIVLQTPKSGESPRVAFVRAISRHSKFLVNLYNRFLLLKSSFSSFLSAPFSSTAVSAPAADAAGAGDAARAEQALWQMQEKILNTYAQLVKKDGAHFVFASWTGSWVATSTAEQFPRHMDGISARGNFQYADLAPAYRAEEVASGREGVYPCNPHWNQDGNRYAADALFGYLTAHPALLSRPSP